MEGAGVLVGGTTALLLWMALVWSAIEGPRDQLLLDAELRLHATDEPIREGQGSTDKPRVVLPRGERQS
jgi:hypothetical protein